MVEASPRLGFARATTRMLYLGGRCFLSSTADVARPSALREAWCERSAPVIARLFLSLVLQPLPPDDAERRVPGRGPFARILNGIPARPLEAPPQCRKGGGE